MQILRQLDVHPKVREEADILIRTFSGAIGNICLYYRLEYDVCHIASDFNIISYFIT